MKLARHSLALLGATILASVSPHHAFAQAGTSTSETASADQKGEIIVQARRRDETLSTVPIAITAITTETIAERQIVTTQDLTLVTPGLNVAPGLSRDIPAYVIRGQQRFVSGAGAPAVLAYFADVPLPTDGSLLPAFDVASLQVLKGPQGTLFGRNTTGGAVLFYPTAPSFEFGGYGRASYGKYNEFVLEGAINLPIVADKLALRIAGQRARRDAYTKNLGIGDDLDDRHTDAIRVSLLAQLTETLKNTFIFDYYRAREAGTGVLIASTFPSTVVTAGGLARTPAPAFRALFDCGASPNCDIDLALAQQKATGVRTVYPSLASYSNRDLWGITNTTTLDIGDDITLKNIFGYRHVDIDYARDYDGSPLRLIDFTGRNGPVQASDEFQILGKSFDNKLDWIVAAFYLDQEFHGQNGALTLTFPPFVPPTYQESYVSTTSKAVFAQGSYKLDAFVEGLRFNAGLRYTWDTFSNCASVRPQAAGPNGSLGACRANGGNLSSTKSSAPTWSVGLDLQATRDLFFYATTRRGYRSAGVNQSGLAPALVQYADYAPEKVTDIEIGAKASWSAGGLRGRFNIAAYRSKYDNIQITFQTPANLDGDGITTNDPFSLTINAAKATIQGVEADTSIALTRGLTIGGFLNYTDAGYDSFSVAPAFVPLLGVNPVTNKFVNVPKWTGGANLHYDTALPDKLGKLSFNVNYFRSGRLQFSGRANEPNYIQKPYDTVNTRLDWDDIGGSAVGAGIFVRNLFNAQYATAAGFAVSTFSIVSRIYNEPRIYGAELRVRF